MTEIRHYTVTQVREIQVTAKDEVQAAVLATKLFDGEKFTAEPGISVTRRVAIVELNVAHISDGW